MFPVGNQIVQRGGISERGGLPHRRVEILLLAVRAEGGGVERHQRRAAGLRALYALNGRMNGGNHVLPSGNQTLPFFAFLQTVVVLPRLFDCLILVGKRAVYTENQVCARDDGFKLPLQRGMF